MAKNTAIKIYKKKLDYSYTLGTFPTVEMIENIPSKVHRVLYHSNLDSEEQMNLLSELCGKNGIPFIEASRQVEKVRDKDSIFVVGVFEKFERNLDGDRNHLVLVNPSDMGNMGTIMRTALAYGVEDIAIIEPGVDVFNPKVVRSSMGALFHLRFRYFTDFESYERMYGSSRHLYSFMLTGSVPLQGFKKEEGLWSLIFGNESTGLPDSFSKKGQSIRIENTEYVDSLNLGIAAGCGLYVFTEDEFKKRG